MFDRASAHGPASSVARRHRYVAVVATALVLVVATPCGAQFIECDSPKPRPDGSCRLEVDAGNAWAAIRVRVVDAAKAPIPGARVSFKASSGSIQQSAVTDAAGMAAVAWSAPAVTGPVDVEAVIDHQGHTARRSLVIAAAPKTVSPYTLEIVGRERVWFPERQLPDSIVVQISAPETQCDDVFVNFRPLGDGGSAPDSVQARWRTAAAGLPSGCFAAARWKLGKDIGEYRLRVMVAGQPQTQQTVTAKARALPRVILGLAFSRVSAHEQLTTSDRTIKVTRRTGDEEIAFDSVATSARIENGDRYVFSPVLGVDWAPWREAAWLRLSVGAAVENARNEWFVGVSALQPWRRLGGFHREAIGFDVQAVVHFQRRMEITNIAACRQIVASCTTERQPLRATGVGVMVVMDGVSLFSQLITAFGVTAP